MAFLYAHDFALHRKIENNTIAMSLIQMPPQDEEIREVINKRLQDSNFSTIDIFVSGSKLLISKVSDMREALLRQENLVAPVKLEKFRRQIGLAFATENFQ